MHASLPFVAPLLLFVLPVKVLPAQQDPWSHDLEVALQQAQASEKDVLVVCLDPIRDGWSRKLRDAVLMQKQFVDAAKEQFELVQLHVGRDDDEIRSLRSPRAATCLLLSADGDEYGQLRYRVHGPKGYLRALQALRAQRAATVAARQLVRDCERAGGDCDGEAFAAMLAALAGAAAKSESQGARLLLAEGVRSVLSKMAGDCELANDPAQQEHVARVMLAAGFTAPRIDQWANRLDPGNEKALLELTLVPAFRAAHDDASVRRALAALDRVCVLGLRNLEQMKPVLVAAVRLAAGRLGDRGRAASYGDQLQPLLAKSPDAAVAQMLARLR